MPIINIAAGLLIGLAFLSATPEVSTDPHRERLTIDAASGSHEFLVEMATTPREQSRGLMHRKSMAPNHGMLFTIKPHRAVSFWMKNTFIPLDMLFLAGDGTVLQIERMTEPLTLDGHRSGGPVAGVLELNGGLTAELDIRIGDTVRHPFFRNLQD